MGFKDKDEFLDGLYDHIFDGDDEPDDEFFDHVAKFFDQFDVGEEKPQSRRRQRAQVAKPKRRKSEPSNEEPKIKAVEDSGYGSKLFYGKKESA